MKAQEMHLWSREMWRGDEQVSGNIVKPTNCMKNSVDSTYLGPKSTSEYLVGMY